MEEFVVWKQSNTCLVQISAVQWPNLSYVNQPCSNVWCMEEINCGTWVFMFPVSCLHFICCWLHLQIVLTLLTGANELTFFVLTIVTCVLGSFVESASYGWPLLTPLMKYISELTCCTEAASSKLAVIYPHRKWEGILTLLAPMKTTSSFFFFFFFSYCTLSLTRPYLTLPWVCLYIASRFPACMPQLC